MTTLPLRAIRSPRLLPTLMIGLVFLLALRLLSLVDTVGEPSGMPARGTAAAGSVLSAISPASAQDRAAQPSAPAQPAERRPAGPAPRSAVEENTGFSASEIEVLQELAQRRAEIDRRSRELAEREALLQAAEKQIERKIQELNQIRTSVEATLRRADDQDEVRKKSLARIFEGMKPPEAARIMEQMELPQLVELLERMKERSASPILGQMHPVRARQVAAELSKRRGTSPGAAAPRQG
jgi:flagellar motility protein MotE (MotC chaperone)